jgi:hypothetical protein
MAFNPRVKTRSYEPAIKLDFAHKDARDSRSNDAVRAQLARFTALLPG